MTISVNSLLLFDHFGFFSISFLFEITLNLKLFINIIIINITILQNLNIFRIILEIGSYLFTVNKFASLLIRTILIVKEKRNNIKYKCYNFDTKIYQFIGLEHICHNIQRRREPMTFVIFDGWRLILLTWQLESGWKSRSSGKFYWPVRFNNCKSGTLGPKGK